LGDKIKKNEMGRVCGTYAKVYRVFWWENLSGRYHLKDLEVDEYVILKKCSRDRMGALTGLLWQRTGTNGGAFVNVAMDVRVP